MDSAHSETRPSNYDSGDEWEIGLGNLIIDLDADLEKDKKQDGTTPAKSGDASPLRIRKMKIKRKVSTPKGDTPSMDSREGACSSSENVPTQTELNAAPPATIKALAPPKSGLAKKTVGVAGAEVAKVDVDTGDQKKVNSVVEGVSTKNLSSKSAESKEPNTGKAGNKGSEKANEDGKKKEGSKRSSDGARKQSGKRPKYDKSSACSVGVDTMDMGTITEPESLGPCEPGTAVTLEGIVWHENDQGVLVVNVTWRNKTYVGTLLDCSQHNWAPPRFCDSPVSDVESRQTKTSSRAKRGRSANNTVPEKYTETRSSMHSKLRNSTMAKGRRTSNSSSTGRKTPPTSLDRTSAAGKRKVKSSDTDATEGDDSLPSAKRTKSSHKSSNSESNSDKNSDGLISCPEPNCNKKYKHINGLRYHKVHAHQKPESLSPSKERAKEKTEGGPTFKKPREDHQGKEKKPQQQSRVDDSSVDVSKLIKDSLGSLAKENKTPPSVPEEVATRPSEDSTASKNTSLTASPSNISSSKNEPQTSVSKDLAMEEGSPKKGGCSPSSSADLSVFDFNPSLEEPEPGATACKSKIHSPEKIITSPTQRPCLQNLESTASKNETAAAVSSILEKIPGKDAESSPDKRSDKERSKEKHKRREKSLLKPQKSTTRPIAPAPPVVPQQQQQQQLIAIPIPSSVVTPGSIAPTQAASVTVTAMPAVTTKMTPVIGSNLKPIQPKPTVMGEPSLVNPSLSTLKDKKQKMKKKKEKKEMTKDKKDRKPEKPSDHRTEESLRIQQPVDLANESLKPKVSYVPPVGEMNILKKALTSSVSPMEMLSTSLSNPVPSAQVLPTGHMPSLEQSPGEPATAKDVPKPVLSQPIPKPPMAGILPSSSVVPEIPKLVSVNHTVNSSLPSYSMPTTGHLQPKGKAGCAAISTSVITKTVQSSLASIPSIPAIEALSLVTAPKTVKVTDPKSMLSVNPTVDTSRKTSSPAYSDISDEGGENHSTVFNKDNSGIRVTASNEHHLKMSSLSLLRGSPETSSERSSKSNVTLPLPVDSQSQKEPKLENSAGIVASERTERCEAVNASPRLPYSDHFKNAAPYLPVDSKHSLQGLDTNISSLQQKSLDAKNVLQQQNVREHIGNIQRVEPVRPITDPVDPHHSSRIHSEHKPNPPHRTEPELNRRVLSEHEKGTYPERTSLGSLSDRRDKESRDIKQHAIERKQDQSHSSREEKREHSTGSSEPRHHHSNMLEGDKRPSSQGSKPSRSVSPAYRNSEWHEKNRYSSSPSRGKPERTSEHLPTSQNGVPGYSTAAGFLHNPYMQYGAIPYDPSHPAFNQSHSPFSPMVAYPALIPGDIPYSTAPRHWQGSSEVRDRSGQSKDSPSSSSSSLSIPSTSRTSEAHERPTKALDMFAHGNDSYSRHRPRSGSPDRVSRPSSSNAPKASSPMTATKSPPRAGVPPDSRSELARRQEAILMQQQMLHQHLHTHQHTHLGMAPIGFPGIVPPYDQYVLAQHQAAAAATGVNPFAVRRE